MIKEKEALIDSIVSKEEVKQEPINTEGLSYQEKLRLEDERLEQEHLARMAETEKKMISAKKVVEMTKTLTAIKLVKSDSKPGMVFENLFIGGVGTAFNKNALKEAGITHILTVANNL